MRISYVTLLVATLLGGAGCDSAGELSNRDPGRVETGEPDRFAMHTRDGEVKLGLTDEVVYLRLSDAVLQKVDREMEAERSQEEGLGAMIAGAVTQGVSSVLKYRMQLPVETIRDVRYEEGRLVFDFVDPDASFPDVQVSGGPVETQFAPEDARRFVEAFHELGRAHTAQ